MQGAQHTLPALEIFRAGTHVDSKGRKLTFTKDEIAATAAAYDPSVYAAPLVIGHPTMDAPAFGQLGKLESRDGTLIASEHTDVHPEFASLVHEKRYPKWSVSFFQPDHPANPKPGVYYPRHLGFLGAMPPAVPGLKMLPASYAADDDQVVEFGAFDSSTIAMLFRGLKNLFLKRDGADEARAAQVEQALPEYAIDQLTINAAEDRAANKPLGYAAPTSPNTTQGDDMSAEQLAAANAARDKAEAEAKSLRDQLASAERAQRAVAYAADADALVKEFKLHPDERDQYVAYMAHCDEHATFDFAAPDGTTKTFDAKTFLSDFIKRRGAMVTAGEVGAGKNKANGASAPAFAAPPGFEVASDRLDLHERATAYAKEHKVDYATAAIAVERA